MKHHQIQYIEFATKSFDVVKKFYSEAFSWEFVDYGTEYIAFEGESVSGGFYIGNPIKGSMMIILYSEKLEESKVRVEKAGGKVTRDIFSFPGGRRFEFSDPDGNNMAVWTDR